VKLNPIPSDIAAFVAYDPETGILTCKTQWSPRVPVGATLGTMTDDGYVYCRFRYKSYGAHRLAFYLMTGVQPGLIDHKDGHRSNNRWSNLRPANRSLNGANRRHEGVLLKGVRRLTRSDRFEARIGARSKRKSLGYFDTEQEAHAAYCRAAVEWYGEFARFA
jgi:hypothetical protein